MTPLLAKYEWILFDADETLFHFDDFKGLQLMFANYGVDFTQKDYLEYQAINRPLWVSYQNGEISAHDIHQQRFTHWEKLLQVSSDILNKDFLTAMKSSCKPIDGAINLINAIKNQTQLGIITNGFTELQHSRLEQNGLETDFAFVVTSEQVGVAKPNPAIFEHALDLMGNPERTRVLMVGDNLNSDIIGGINSGLDTCWLNNNNRTEATTITPKYQVPSLAALERLLFDHP